MKNGFNVSGVSEMVHEFKAKPREAQLDFSAQASWREDRYDLTIQTLNAGTIRIPRDFGLEVRPFNEVINDIPTPQELLILALGSCVLVTYVQGCSARGITLTSLEVHSEGLVPSGEGTFGQKATGLKLKVDIDCEGAPEAIKEIAQFAGCFSPNHRTFVEDNNPSVELSIKDGSSRSFLGELNPEAPTSRKQESPTGGLHPVIAKSIWRYGLQIDSRLESESPFPPNSHSTKGQKPVHKLKVDQPKQLGGIDLAPNPQEYLLAAMAGELAANFVRLARREGLNIKSVSVNGSGRLDLRGILNVAPVPVKMHNLRFHLEVVSDASQEILKRIAGDALSDATSFATISQANEIAVSVKMGGKPLLEFTSNMRHVEMFLTNMREKMRKAQEEKEKSAAPETVPFYKRVFPFGKLKGMKQGAQ